MSEMVLDAGGYFNPAGIFGLHTLSLLLSFRAAHHRTTEGTRTHTLEHTTRVGVGRVTNPRQGGINFHADETVLESSVNIPLNERRFLLVSNV